MSREISKIFKRLVDEVMANLEPKKNDRQPLQRMKL